MESCYSCDSIHLVITSEDDLVCADCGRVNEPITSHNPVPHCGGTEIDQSRETWEVSNLLLDVFARYMIPTFITDRVLLQFSKLKSELRSRHGIEEIAAFATYKILIDEKIPRLLSEISDYFDVDRWKLRRIASEQWQNDINPVDLISPALSRLNIPFRMTQSIEAEIERIRKFSAARPETVLACGIFRAVKETPYRDLKCADIACACGVSTASVRSLNTQAHRFLREEKGVLQDFYLR